MNKNSCNILIGNKYSLINFSKSTSSRTIKNIYRSMTFMDPNYQGYIIWKYAKGNRKKFWDGKIRFLQQIGDNNYTYQFPTGLLSLAVDKLLENGTSFSMTCHENYIQAEPRGIITYDKKLPSGTELRPYQVEAVNKLLENNRGVCRVGTGGGKTEIICAIIDILTSHGNKALILTHRTELFKNIVNRLSIRGITDVSEYGGKSSDTSGKVVVASIPKLWKNIKSKEVQELLLNTRLLIGDEVHHAQSADTWYKIMLATSAPWRFGFTATTMMADEFVAEEMKLRAVTGDIVVDIPVSWLIENNYLAKPRITMVEFKDRVEFLEKELINLVKKIIPKGPTLIIVKSLSEGDSITKEIERAGVRTCFVQGVTTSQVRDKAREDLDAGNIDVLVSSVIMKEGVDIPNVKNLINLCDEKKHRSAIQIVGRALRGGGDVFVYDPVFTADSGSVRRATERMRAYAAEGFEVRRSKRAQAKGD